MNICKVCYYRSDDKTLHKPYCKKHFRHCNLESITKCDDFLGKKKGRIKDINSELREIRKIKNEMIEKEQKLVDERKELNQKLKDIKS
ncbi:MAG: hypothetical protein ACRDD7_09360 [Peptostreptococcaceae bacterium]